MNQIKKVLLAIVMSSSLYACTSGEKTSTAEKQTTSKNTANEVQRTTNQDGSTEVTLDDGSSITFEKGTSEADIQAAIKAIQSGELKTSQGNLNGGDDTDQSQDIDVSDADSIEMFN